MPSPAHPRATRAVVAAAICVAVVATVPALGDGATGVAAEVPRASTQVLTEASTRPQPAPSQAGVPTPMKRAKGTEDDHAATTRKQSPKAKQLGRRLQAVARNTGWTTKQLQHVLAHDDSAHVAPEGRVFYREEAPATPPERAEAVAPAFPTSQTFSLHSRSGATRKIFLDFDGATVSNTGWNGSGQGDVPNGTHTGLSLDATPGSFTSAEHGYMQEVWRQVSETYAPFDVDVTTQDPGAAGITRSSASDTSYGSHVLITSDRDPYEALCDGCLGVAWVGTFDNVDPGGYYQPAWVFHYNASFDPMIIAQAASHETGHNLGLSHDGTSSAPYYGGTSAWGPVMGSSMHRAVSQFSKGEYTGASNVQDDFAVMASNGLPLRSDDHAGTTNLGSQASYSTSGVVSTRADTDSFAISLPCTTSLTVSAQGIGAQTALDLSLTVLDGSGTAVASNAPAATRSGSPPVSGGMNTSVTIPDATGDYVLRVDGVGHGNPAWAAWSDYGSLGQYTLTATGCSGGSPARRPRPPPLPRRRLPRRRRRPPRRSRCGRRRRRRSAGSRPVGPVDPGRSPCAGTRRATPAGPR